MTPTTAHIDPRYSDEKAEAVPWTAAVARLGGAEVAWIVTVRPDGSPTRRRWSRWSMTTPCTSTPAATR
jgi:hypothetical protein